MPKNNLNKLLKLFLFSILISLCSLSLALAPNPIRIEAEDYFLLQGADLGASFDEGGGLTNGTISSQARFKTYNQVQSRIDAMDEFLDIDGNGEKDALTDGLLVLRYLFGLSSNQLTDDAVSVDSSRDTNQIIQYLNDLKPMDSDKNGIYDEFELP